MSDRIRALTRRVGSVMGSTLVYVLIWAGLVLLIAALGIRFYWGKISVNQLLLNLISVQVDGGGGAIVWIGVVAIGVVPLLVTGGIALLRYLRRRKRRFGRHMQSRRSARATRIVCSVAVAAIVVAGSSAFASAVGVVDYIKAANSDFDLGDYYVKPIVTDDEHKRNLVLIYLESGEATLADGQLFEKDAFAPLKEVTTSSDGWQSIKGLQEYEGGGWTMAGITATQCGVPLKGMGTVSGNAALNELGGVIDTYLGGATCLGDVLEDHGYTNVFLGGADASFAAKDTFLRSHGYSDVKDLNVWRAAGEPEESIRDWGLSDERLMAHAKDEIDELHAEAARTGQPFNLSVLTLDTHEPVHVFDYCPVDTEDAATSVFSCSMAQVAGFVSYMEEKGYLDDTAVVIMGDHLKQMSAGSAFHEQLAASDNRSIFNRIWIPGENPGSTLRPDVDQMNLYPTILEAAGLTLQDSEAGLGVSAFAPSVSSNSAQAMMPEPYAELLNSRSEQFYATAWAGQDAPQ
ncbi:LTA synthase family protein [Arthrobacter sp. NamB2]|uniref:LTA synthase family protein n=1 Tax=Arthrobacter sp. NamB2 TaxID=2576035 RepID=UPI0010C9C83D|nr:LTA synthase family protein [Arthrobacter sp. NamB2]TKV29426.1 LTA synthase family protein [Arthrobacter sp. NamB2]